MHVKIYDDDDNEYSFNIKPQVFRCTYLYCTREDILTHSIIIEIKTNK